MELVIRASVISSFTVPVVMGRSGPYAGPIAKRLQQIQDTSAAEAAAVSPSAHGPCWTPERSVSSVRQSDAPIRVYVESTPKDLCGT